MIAAADAWYDKARHSSASARLEEMEERVDREQLAQPIASVYDDGR